MIVHRSVLDMVPGKGAATPKVNLSQGDQDFTLEFVLVAREGTLTLESGTVAKLVGKKGGGTAYEAAATVAKIGNEIIVTVAGDANLTNEPGRGTYEVRLTHNGRHLQSANFSITVEKNPTGGES